MMRYLHSVPGIAVALLICVLALSGALLAIEPVVQHTHAATPPVQGMSVATLASRIVDNNSNVERITRKANGTILVYGSMDGGGPPTVADPQTGRLLGPYQRSVTFDFAAELHRSLFLGKTGRGVVGFGAFVLILLVSSGALMLARRAGGWSKIFSKAQGGPSQRLHIIVARVTAVGLTLSALTGVYLSLSTFEIVPDGALQEAPFPQIVSASPPRSVASLKALQSIDISDFRELIFPLMGDQSDAFAVTTTNGHGFVDQSTGRFLSFVEHDFGARIY